MSAVENQNQPENWAVQARSLIRDLDHPVAWIYWTDFLITMAIGNVGFFFARFSPLFSVQEIVGFLVAGLAYYRGVTFIHEIVHIRNGTFVAFRVVWNLLCGIPFLVPSFMYYTHLDHHRAMHYGTQRDGEYLPLARRSPWTMIVFLLQGFYAPILGVIRYAILGPITWFNTPLRDWVYKHASSIVIYPAYIRPAPSKQQMRIIRLQEVLCFAWCLTAALGPPLVLGRSPIYLITLGYLLACFVLTVNTVRTLVSHRWNHEDEKVSFADQILDSVDFPRGFWAELWAPVGMRYHALHHLAPTIPYHSMPAAHRRLMAELPPESPYRQVAERSMLSAFGTLWRQAQAHRAELSEVASLP